jgi:hypothetical protein
MWEPRPLATLGAPMACNRDIFTFYLYILYDRTGHGRSRLLIPNPCYTLALNKTNNAALFHPHISQSYRRAVRQCSEHAALLESYSKIIYGDYCFLLFKVFVLHFSQSPRILFSALSLLHPSRVQTYKSIQFPDC